MLNRAFQISCACAAFLNPLHEIFETRWNLGGITLAESLRNILQPFLAWRIVLSKRIEENPLLPLEALKAGANLCAPGSNNANLPGIYIIEELKLID
jgi:hypothetical protein